jgi:hypothetical protein
MMYSSTTKFFFSDNDRHLTARFGSMQKDYSKDLQDDATCSWHNTNHTLVASNAKFQECQARIKRQTMCFHTHRCIASDRAFRPLASQASQM